MSLEPRRGYQGTNLVDILDRILDKGLVVAGDVRISLANVELLTIRIRLLVCSIDKAEQIGLNWWRYDRSLVAQDDTEDHDHPPRESHRRARTPVGPHPELSRLIHPAPSIPTTKEVNSPHASR